MELIQLIRIPRSLFSKVSVAGIALYSYRRPWIALAVLSVFIGVMSIGLTRLQIDTSSEGLLPYNDEARVNYRELKETFGDDSRIVVGVHYGEKITPQVLKQFENVTVQLKAIKGVKDVESLATARITKGEDDTLSVYELAEYFNKGMIGDGDIHALLASDPLYRKYLINTDNNIAAIFIEPSEFYGDSRTKLSDAEMNLILQDVEAQLKSNGIIDYLLVGAPVATLMFNQTTMNDMILCCSLCLIGVVAFLSVFFRRVSGVLLPLSVIYLSIGSTFGFVGLLDIPFSLTTNCIVPFLMTMAICDSVHILNRFYQEYDSMGDKDLAITLACHDHSAAIFYTSLTTSIGLGSFYVSDLQTISDLGLYSSVGVMIAFLFTVILLPALIRLIPIKRKSNESKVNLAVQSLLDKLVTFTIRNNILICVVFTSLIIIMLPGLLKLGFSHDPLHDFPDDAKIKLDTLQYNQAMGGANSIDVVINTKLENGVYEPEFLRIIEKTTAGIVSNPDLAVTADLSILDVIKESNKALHNSESQSYSIPQSKQLIVQELFLFSLSDPDGLSDFVSSDASKTKVSLRLRHLDGVETLAIINKIKAIYQRALGDAIDVSISGIVAVDAYSIPKALDGLWQSNLTSFLLVCCIMCLALKNFRLGLLCMLPNIFPIVMVFGFMGYMGMTLDMTTIMIGSIALGVVVDDTIHLALYFQTQFKSGYTVQDSIRQAIKVVGPACILTSLLLVGGFGTDVFASLANVVRLGYLIALAVILAMFWELIYLPALLTVFVKRKEIDVMHSAHSSAKPAVRMAHEDATVE